MKTQHSNRLNLCHILIKLIVSSRKKNFKNSYRRQKLKPLILYTKMQNQSGASMLMPMTSTYPYVLADTIYTYYQDKLGLTHYLFFVGNNSSGKSNNLRVLQYLAYRNMTSTDITEQISINSLVVWKKEEEQYVRMRLIT